MDHVYLTFKTEEAVQNLKKHLPLLDETSFWKQSCRISFRPNNCPEELMEKIEANSAAVTSSPDVSPSARQTNKKLLGESKAKGVPIKVGISKQTLTESGLQTLRKRSRDDASHLERQNKKRHLAEGSTTLEPMLDGPSHQDTRGHLPPYDGGTEDSQSSSGASSTTTTLTPKSALVWAKQAAKIAGGKPKRNREAQELGNSKEELEQLRAERDEAIAQRDTALKSCQDLGRELRRLKRSVKEKGKKTEQVLQLVTASLQSLQESLEMDE